MGHQAAIQGVVDKDYLGVACVLGQMLQPLQTHTQGIECRQHCLRTGSPAAWWSGSQGQVGCLFLIGNGQWRQMRLKVGQRPVDDRQLVIFQGK